VNWILDDSVLTSPTKTLKTECVPNTYSKTVLSSRDSNSHLARRPWASTPLEHGGSQVERRRRENRGAVRGEGGGSGEGLCPFVENL